MLLISYLKYYDLSIFKYNLKVVWYTSILIEWRLSMFKNMKEMKIAIEKMAAKGLKGLEKRIVSLEKMLAKQAAKDKPAKKSKAAKTARKAKAAKPVKAKKKGRISKKRAEAANQEIEAA